MYGFNPLIIFQAYFASPQKLLGRMMYIQHTADIYITNHYRSRPCHLSSYADPEIPSKIHRKHLDNLDN